MKKITTIGKSAIIAMALALAISCSGDDGGSGTGGNSGSYMKAKVDGASFNASISGQSTVVAVKAGSGDGTVITVTGTTSNFEAMNIGLVGITQTGTYEINPQVSSDLAYVTTTGQQSYDTSDCSGATGTVTITELTDDHIKGTFSFTGKVDEDCSQSKSITNGTFRGVFMQN